MTDGFSISTVEAGFSFFGELEKLGFKHTDDPKADFPTEYEGIMYDYESDSYVKVYVEREEKCFRGTFSKYVRIYKSVRGKGTCIYNGLQPQSRIIYEILMTNLFPSEYYIKHYEEVVSEKEYEESFGKRFDMEYSLEKFGYTTQDKSQECLSTKGNISIYYAVPDMGYYDEFGHPIGCQIADEGKVIYKGKMPSNVKELIQLLKKLQIE